MAQQFTVRQALRTATGDSHERVDAAFSGFDLSDHTSYGRFLSAQAAAHIPVEAALEQSGIASVLPDWPSRQRADLLRADLAALGLSPPAAGALPAFDTAAEMLGAVYVLEGSRLGGALLRRSVPADLPCSFLGAGDSAAWRRLLEVLDLQVRDVGDIDRATNGALRVFSLFEQSGKQFLKAE
ncbi:MAG: biliverdin-producing heme oxygenase [Sphingomonadaceae bacterium]|nr:biliverdin-producing heme oxygenase [Sphingomonadaceae bacterium]